MDFLHQLWLAPAPAIPPPYLDVNHGAVEMKNHSPACLPHPYSTHIRYSGDFLLEKALQHWLTAQTRPCCLNLRQVELSPS